MARFVTMERTTRETDIRLTLRLDGTGDASIETGIGFFDHMIEQTVRHGRLDLEIRADGDRTVDDHHTVEDVGIVLGEAVDRALGDALGVRRYGWALTPMDEALAQVAIDLSGRGLAVLPSPFDGTIGSFDAQLIDEFLVAFARTGRMTLHAHLLAGRNRHHRAEALFKALGLALRDAVALDNQPSAVPSTKGVLR